MIELPQNYFTLFDIPESFDIDSAALSAQYRALQSQVHPDKFANSSEYESRVAVQMTAHVNEGFATLKSTATRARYLLEVKGVSFDDEREVSRDPEYLMQQMALREAIESVPESDDPHSALDAVILEVKQHRKVIEQAFAEAFAEADYTRAKVAAVKLRFCKRIDSELLQVEEKLDEWI